MAGIFACCSCIPDTPVDDDPRKGYANRWQINMGNAPCEEPGSCLYGMLCPCCGAYQLRKRALGGTLDNYQCCQGYLSIGCIQPGSMGESGSPELCLCLETCCCLGCAVSATRFYIMDQYNIVSDPCDNRIIRFNNCLQLLSCVLSLLSICIEELRDAARIVDLIAKLVFYATVGCMHAQASRELTFREQQGQGHAQGGQAPPTQEGMQRMEDLPVAEAKPVDMNRH